MEDWKRTFLSSSMSHVLNCFDDSSWTTSFSRRAINNLIQLLYPQLWPRKRGFLGFTPLWWWQRPHRCPHRSHTSDLQRAKHWWCLRSVVERWRHCYLGTFPVWWWQQWILSCIGKRGNNVMKLKGSVSATGKQSIYCKAQPNRVSDYLLLVFKGVCWLIGYFWTTTSASSFCIQLMLPVYFACAKVQTHIICLFTCQWRMLKAFYPSTNCTRWYG